MIRHALALLKRWKETSSRKPVLITGARQVGKTWLMKEFGETHFSTYIYINFERDKLLVNLFDQDFDVQRIINAIEIFFGKKITPGETLLILDEIQEVKGGLTSLKYFQEELPELHIIGAGSLLGITLKQSTSFPVGKVNFLHLYPMSFTEFLNACGQEGLGKVIQDKDWSMASLFKEKFREYLRYYLYTGGMPEAVLHFSSTGKTEGVRAIQENILFSYQNDFAKHAPKDIIPRLHLIWNNLVSQLAKENKKYIYGMLKEGARAREFESALSWLEDYGLVYKIYRVNKAGIPLKGYQDKKAFKLYALDVGLLGAMVGLSEKALLEGDALFTHFKGALSEQYVMQQLISKGHRNLFYWSNESGQAEVDLITEYENVIYPIEIKSAENLQSKSLKTFSEKHKDIHCYRTSLSDFRKENWLTNVPLYGIEALI
jgi:uncharacterized protein